MKHKRKKFGFTPLEIEVSNRGSDGASKRFLTGFTMVELLTVLGIMLLLVALLLPSLSMVRKIAKETQQKAQFSTIDFTLMTFKSDYGNYPPSDNLATDYCGAQKLAEALVGWDLLGFQPSSAANAWGLNFIADGHIEAGGVYDPDNLDGRRGPYLELATANAFTLRQLFDKNEPGWVNPINSLAVDRFVLCDSFGRITVTIGGRTVRAGLPILYYRANTSSRLFRGGRPESLIYNYEDNDDLVDVKRTAKGTDDPLLWVDGEYLYSDDYKLIDWRVTARNWPHRPDSYILISAGADGLYGTTDDITNFGN